MANEDPNQQSLADGLLGGVSQQAQDKVGGVIDGVAAKVPGGDAIAQQAKDVAAGALGQFEQQATQQVAERLGGLGGLGGVLGGALGGLLGGHGGAPSEPSGQGTEGQSQGGAEGQGQSGQSGS